MPPIISLDLEFLGFESTISSYLVITSEGPVLVETGPHSTIHRLEELLRGNGFSSQDVKHVFITHIHLDHAGAAWYFAQKGARIYVHPRGVKHLAQPERLMESASRIYKDKMDELWGKMNPIDLKQLVSVDDGQTVTIGDIQIVAIHTPGHATHHTAWQVGEVIFTGDVAGVKIGSGPVLPPCPPPDIDLEDWKRSIGKLRNRSAKKLLLTHFGEVEDIEKHLEELEKGLDAWAQWIKLGMDEGLSIETMVPLFQQFVTTGLEAKGLADYQIKQYEAANPAWMSVAGLVRYWSKRLS